ncbi:hypothetical protein D6817_00865 [Candidatus Pacearchaeota archaeon]|nr:MAG: hypothetical protein D6817_00865 [Candidatus Pacearchaeota archaeon]
MRDKRAQSSVGISFGMIFSILIIIFLVAVAIYAIKTFLSVNKCAQTGLLYDRLQSEVDDAWRSGLVREEVGLDLPASGIRSTSLTHLCFGKVDPNNVPAGLVDDERERYEKIAEVFGVEAAESNVFVYPPTAACGRSLAHYQIKHLAVPAGFFCKQIVDGKVVVNLEKETSSPVVLLKP